MTIVSLDPTTGRQSFEASVPCAELHCFARDLGGSTLHVLVAAAGRALGQHPEIALSLAGDEAAVFGVGISVGPSDEALVPVVRDASTASLPHLRAEVDRVVAAARAGSVAAADSGPAPITVAEQGVTRHARGAARADVRGCVLEAEPVADDPQVLRVALSVGPSSLGPEDATQLLATVARLLGHPYRRLV